MQAKKSNKIHKTIKLLYIWKIEKLTREDKYFQYNFSLKIIVHAAGKITANKTYNKEQADTQFIQKMSIVVKEEINIW